MSEDTADKAVAHVACPDCGEVIPLTLGPIELRTDDEGQQFAHVELETDDVWAHAFTHQD